MQTAPGQNACCAFDVFSCFWKLSKRIHCEAIRRISIAGIVVSAFAGGAIATPLARLANIPAGSTVLVVAGNAFMIAAELSAVAVLCIAAGLTLTIDAVTIGTRSVGVSTDAET